MLYKNWGQQELSKLSQRNDKSPLLRKKQDKYPVITTYVFHTMFGLGMNYTFVSLPTMWGGITG